MHNDEVARILKMDRATVSNWARRKSIKKDDKLDSIWKRPATVSRYRWTREEFLDFSYEMLISPKHKRSFWERWERVDQSVRERFISELIAKCPKCQKT